MSRAQEALRARRKEKERETYRTWQLRLIIWGTILFLPGLIAAYHVISGRPFKAIWDEKTRCCWEADARGLEDSLEFSAPVQIWREQNEAYRKDMYSLPMGFGEPRYSPSLPQWVGDDDILHRQHYPVYYKVKKEQREARFSHGWLR